MARGVLFFLIFTFLFYVGIDAFRATTGQQKWHLLKTLTYSLLCAILSLTILFWIVILF